MSSRCPLCGSAVGAYSNPNDLFAATLGLRWPNKDGTIGNGFRHYGQYASYAGPVWDLPAGKPFYVGFSNARTLEDNKEANEEQVKADGTIRVATLTYTDAMGVMRTVRGTLSNGGVLSSTEANGGVIASFLLPAVWPKGNPWKVGLSLSVPDGARMPVGGCLFPGDSARKHASSDFDAAVLANASLTSIAGTSSASWSGYYIHPCWTMGYGADGRPVFFNDGDSIANDKGTPPQIAKDRIAGILQTALARTENGYAIPCIDTTIAGSSAGTTDPANANYDPDVRKHTRALIDQAIALNGGKRPWSHYLEEHGNNFIQASVAAHKRVLGTRHQWLNDWHPAPIIQTTMIPKATSGDGFRSLAGQTVIPNDAIGGTRWNFNADLLATKLDGTVDHAVNTYAGISYDDGPNRDKFKIAWFTACLTRDLEEGASLLYLSAAPEVGAALALDPYSGAAHSRIVVDVDYIGPGEYAVETKVGSMFGSYPAKPVGTLVGEHFTADGQSRNTGLHITKRANEKVAAWQGPNSFDQLKADLKAAVGGNWS